MKLLDLKINRHTYEITSEDRFLDNGACVQLLTQSKEKSSWGKAPNPVLTKKAVKSLGSLKRVEYPSYYKERGCVFFGLTDPGRVE